MAINEKNMEELTYAAIHRPILADRCLKLQHSSIWIHDLLPWENASYTALILNVDYSVWTLFFNIHPDPDDLHLLLLSIGIFSAIDIVITSVDQLEEHLARAPDAVAACDEMERSFSLLEKEKRANENNANS